MFLRVRSLIFSFLLVIPLFSATAEESWQRQALQLENVERLGDELRWGGAEGFALLGKEAGQVFISTVQGKIAVDPRLFAQAEAVQKLHRLLAHLQGQEAQEGLRYLPDPLTGPRLLLGDRQIVTEAGILERQDLEVLNRREENAAVSARAGELISAIDASSLGPHARSALRHLILLLDQEDRNPVSDEINPAFARKVVRYGWLQDALDILSAPSRALTQAVQQVTTLRPMQSYQGADGLRLVRYGDAWGVGSELYETPQGVRLASPHPLPMYHWPMQRSGGFAQARVIVDLPAGSDPLANPELLATPQAAALYHGLNKLAGWNPEEGLIADDANWRAVVAARGQGLDSNIVDNYMPPHIIVSDGHADIYLVLSRHGALRPPRDGSKEEADRFMNDAAALLPDAAHLDLISQYLFKYVYDSPDPTMPLLLGNRESKSDIHQTVWETLSATAGGVFRGDCDDLSEVMEHIVDRQGRTGHVISLPGHAALAWAEHFDEQWHVFILQTGPTLQFSDPRLQQALRAAYTSFDASDTFDPNGIGLLLRFSGENTRSAWRLSYRIFSEPEYAATMIDVQKDWHYQTYLQGIRKMLDLIAGGDEDTANYREMAGLYSFTGQYDKAIEYHRIAMERTDEAESQLLMAIELLHHLNDAERHEELQAEALDILDNRLPALRQELGQSIVQVGLQLAGILSRADQPILAARALRDVIGPALAAPAQNIARWSQKEFNEEAWRHNPQLRMVDRILRWHSHVLTRIIEADRDGSVQAAVSQLAHFRDIDRVYRQYIAFNSSYDAGDLTAAYALQGRHLQAQMGRESLLERLDAASLPEERIEHRHRSLPADDLLARDLQWIKASVAFWNDLVTASIEDIRERALTREEADRILPQLDAAVAAAEGLGMSGPRTDYQEHFTRVILALIREDRPAMEALLQHVRSQNDKRLTDNTAQYMGDVAYMLSEEWFTTVVEMWRDIVDHKPKYLWIAWRAALNHAPRHALIAARIAAERFSDDQSFVDEYAFMQELLGDE